jgi:hypothetical protein
MNIQAKVAIDKQRHPERFCPEPRCLWKTAKLNHKTQAHVGGGYCPRHRKAELNRIVQEKVAEIMTDANPTPESTKVIVSRLRSYRLSGGSV